MKSTLIYIVGLQRLKCNTTTFTNALLPKPRSATTTTRKNIKDTVDHCGTNRPISRLASATTQLD